MELFPLLHTQTDAELSEVIHQHCCMIEHSGHAEVVCRVASNTF